MIKDNRQGEAPRPHLTRSPHAAAYRIEGRPSPGKFRHDLTEVRPLRACHAEFVIFELRHDIYGNRRAELALWNI